MALTLYSADYCPFCQRARMLLDGKGLKYTLIDIMSVPTARQEMIARSGRHTIPQLFNDDRHIGDCSEMLALDANGKLDPLLVTTD